MKLIMFVIYAALVAIVASCGATEFVYQAVYGKNAAQATGSIEFGVMFPSDIQASAGDSLATAASDVGQLDIVIK